MTHSRSGLAQPFQSVVREADAVVPTCRGPWGQTLRQLVQARKSSPSASQSLRRGASLEVGVQPLRSLGVAQLPVLPCVSDLRGLFKVLHVGCTSLLSLRQVCYNQITDTGDSMALLKL